ncbi:MAG: DNA polymerase III subunit gamma/tau [Proteobacteria bacterium]|nr:DNA polymerase III subunit gamma/tau [Pseudomonadota bacterium]
MSYLVLARKYRPQTFDDVIEQNHVTQTLQNAIQVNRVPHAILFSGPRGTGKTTIARILAKAMNCKEGPTPTPCNLCRSCREITSGNAVDVFEIDGASNNSVDQVRELRDNIKYMPAHSALKIYIIDEVHMLSISAFNALLKTLEEPPSHVMFMFATTEPHKIPLTILSRCQRHDLKRVGIAAIASHMRSIVDKENIHVNDESLYAIAKESEGCVRDALSLLDQVISCSDGNVNHEDMIQMLGLIDKKVMFDISDAILTGNATCLLDILDDLYNRGQDIKKLYARLIHHFRNLLVVKIGRRIDKLTDVPDHEKKMISDQVKQIQGTFLNQIIDILFREESTIRFSDQPKLALEMIFIKLLQVKPTLSIDTLIEKLDALRNDLLKTESGKHALSQVLAPASSEETVKNISIPSEKPVCEQSIPVQNITDKQPLSNVSPAQEKPGRKDENSGDTATDTFYLQADKNEPIATSWQNLLKIFEKDYPPIGACLQKSVLKKLTGQSMELEVSGSNFEINRARNDKSMAAIRKVFRNYFGRKMDVVIHAKPEEEMNFEKKLTRENELRKEAKSHPLVEEAIKTLNPKQINIKIIQEIE